MRHSLYRSSEINDRSDMTSYNENLFRKDFERAMKNGDLYGTPLKKNKRFRSAFTTEQVNYLEREFKKYPYIGNARRKDVSNVLNMPERAIKIWFQNRRMKEKKDLSKESGDKSGENNNNIVANNSLQSFQPKLNNGKSTLSLPVLRNQETPVTTPSSPDSIEVVTSSPLYQLTEGIHENNEMPSESTKLAAETTVIKTNAASVSSSRDTPTNLFMKYKNEQMDEANEGGRSDDFNNVYLRTNTAPNKKFSLKKEEVNYAPFPASSVSPQDLSAKTNYQGASSINQTPLYPDMKVCPTDVPMYLKGFYTQPYVPPGNIMWKPVNVAPIMPTTIPGVAVPTSSTSPTMLKRSCNCDCHLKQTPIFFQQSNPNTNLQYVITAVPLQNGIPKF